MGFFMADRILMDDDFRAGKLVHDQKFDLIGDFVGLNQGQVGLKFQMKLDKGLDA